MIRKQSNYSRFTRKKKPPKRKPPTTEYCKKDVGVNIIADDNVEPEYKVIFDQKYFGKCPRGQKPYGFGTGISLEEWKKDCDNLRLSRKNMHGKEVERWNGLVESGWIRTEESQSFKSKVPAPIQLIIKRYAETQPRNLWGPFFPCYSACFDPQQDIINQH